MLLFLAKPCIVVILYFAAVNVCYALVTMCYVIVRICYVIITIYYLMVMMCYDIITKCYVAVVPRFAELVDRCIDGLSSNPPREVDESEFVDCSNQVYDGVHEIRQAVLMNRVNSFIFIQPIIVNTARQLAIKILYL